MLKIRKDLMQNSWLRSLTFCHVLIQGCSPKVDPWLESIDGYSSCFLSRGDQIHEVVCRSTLAWNFLSCLIEYVASPYPICGGSFAHDFLLLNFNFSRNIGPPITSNPHHLQFDSKYVLNQNISIVNTIR